MRLVLDTNVLVSALLSPFGPPGQIVRMLEARVVTPLYDDRIVAEYQDVLYRPRFPFAQATLDALLHDVHLVGEFVIADALDVVLPDRDDLTFLEVAVSGAADALVTGNARHFVPVRGSYGVRVMSPAEFIRGLG
jgi:putative PIN family toxin of toxin-antitoxin system